MILQAQVLAHLDSVLHISDDVVNGVGNQIPGNVEAGQFDDAEDEDDNAAS